LLVLSVILGAFVFVRLIGPDAWLIKGLRGDQPAAVVAFCSLVVCGGLIFCGLRFSLSSASALFEGVVWGTTAESPVERGRSMEIWNAMAWFLSLCVPVLTALVLSTAYRWVDRVLRRILPQ